MHQKFPLCSRHFELSPKTRALRKDSSLVPHPKYFDYYGKWSVHITWIKTHNGFHLKYSCLPCISVSPAAKCEQTRCHKPQRIWYCLCWDSLPNLIRGNNPWESPRQEKRHPLQHSQPEEHRKGTMGVIVNRVLPLAFICVVYKLKESKF